MEQPSFFSILPALVRYDDRLTDSEKIFFSEITALSNKYGYCNATNGYFSKLYNVSKITVSRRINKLKELGHLSLEIVREGKEIKERKLYPITNINTPINTNDNTPINTNDNTPINTNVKENNTRFNNTSINRERDKKNDVDCIKEYQNKIGVISPNQLQQLLDWIEDFNKNDEGEHIVSEAIEQARNESAFSFSYINNKLKKYAKNNVETLEQAKNQIKSKQNTNNKDEDNILKLIEEVD